MERKNDARAFYQEKQRYLIQMQNKNKKMLHAFVWLRLIGFFVMLSMTYLTFAYSYWWMIALAGSVTTFFMLVKRNIYYSYQQKYFQKGLWIVDQEMKALNGEQTEWYDGVRFLQKGSVGFDLDLYGSFSLFHALNRTSTQKGAIELAHFLATVKTEATQIAQKQQAIKEVSEQNEFRQNWQILAQLLEEKKNVEQLLTVEEDKFIQNKWWPLLIGVLSGACMAAIGYAYFTGIFSYLSIAFLINLSIVGNYLKTINRKHAQVSGANNTLNGYKELIRLYISIQWHSNINQNNKTKLQNADKAIEELEKISERFDRRLNVLIAVVFNGIWLNDILLSWQLEKWNNKYLVQLPQWLDVLYEVEAWQSLGTYAFNNANTHIYPAITHQKQLLFEELAHPLMHAQKRVANSYGMSNGEKICLITGSNMSGKSTFLRTIGVNVIMAQAGLPVCAKRFEFTPMHICSSLRQTDSLEDNVSLFHAELLKLSTIRDEVRQNQLTLVLIDEMLRGTNSEDKLYGSGKLIEELLEDNIIGFIATHDLALGELEQKYKAQLKNACFESVIEKDELKFDYKLKEGVARNKNATFLLKKMGIIKG